MAKVASMQDYRFEKEKIKTQAFHTELHVQTHVWQLLQVIKTALNNKKFSDREVKEIVVLLSGYRGVSRKDVELAQAFSPIGCVGFAGFKRTAPVVKLISDDPSLFRELYERLEAIVQNNVLEQSGALDIASYVHNNYPLVVS